MFGQFNLFVGADKYFYVTHSLSMLCVNKVRIFPVNLQDVHDHLPNQFGQRKNLAKDGMAAQLLRSCNVEGNADGEEQAPPLNIPGQ